MFCKDKDKGFTMPCSMKWIYEIIAFLSLICSLFVVIITKKMIKINLIHRLILQIIISEILDEINVLLEIFNDSKGKHNFENYDFRMIFCYTQIYLEVFSCLWTLTASFFISLKLYDIIINKNKIFRQNSFMDKYSSFISIAIPLLLSYIFWAIYIIKRADFLNLNDIYVNKYQQGTQSIKLIFCWLNKELTIALSVIAFLLIVGNLYCSLYKGYFFLRKIKQNIILKNDEESPSTSRRINSISQMQSILFLYPIISSIIWIIFFLFMFLFYFNYRNDPSIVWSWIFCIFMTTRQTIFILLYFLSQKNLREYTIKFFKCQICKDNNRGTIYNQIKLLERNNNDNKIINDD